MPGSLSVRKRNAAKYRANGPSAVERQVEKLFGLQPGLQRGNILPFAINPRTKKPEWGAPQFLYDMARAFAAPGVALSGQPIDAEAEATNLALNFTGTGGVASRIGRGALGEGRAVLGMSGVPKIVKDIPVEKPLLALPAPGPGLPSFAVKPKGGQWWPDSPPGFKQAPLSPEEATKYATEHYFVGNLLPKEELLQGWLQRALPKYFRNEFATPDDPLRSLAERGLLHTSMTPNEWSELAKRSMVMDQIGNYTVPGGVKGNLAQWQNLEPAQVYPWMKKLPATENIYGLTQNVRDLQLGHFLDEMHNALSSANATGLPRDLAVRPESLNRMTFPQAVEHVGKINQFRAKEMERAALSALDSPAVRLFKDYPENNPRGLRWVELKAPEAVLPEGATVSRVPGWDGFEITDPRTGVTLSRGATEAETLGLLNREDRVQQLQDALQYEGDTMGHCVGGYCDDVLLGRSRIFSLRDAKGEPHVTIETSPGKPKALLPSGTELNEDFLLSAGLSPTVTRNVLYAINRNKPIIPHLTEARKQFGYGSNPYNEFSEAIPFFKDLDYTMVPGPDEIIQIKGKQNRAPKDDYLPFVQDFVKSQQWSNVGDLANTGLVRLPDGRYLTHDQMDEIIRNEGLDDLYNSYDFAGHGFPRDPEYIDPEDWAQFQRHFEGYAIGGRVDPDRCFCHNPLSAKRR